MSYQRAKRLLPVTILALALAGCGGEAGEPAADEEGEQPAAAETTEAPAERADTWFQASGAAEASSDEADAFFSFEEFSETWMLMVSARDEGTVAFRFPDGFEPEPGEYPIAFTTDEGVIATFDKWDGATFSYDQSGALEISEADETLSATFEFSASTDEEETVTVEGAVTEEIGDAFGPPPASE